VTDGDRPVVSPPFEGTGDAGTTPRESPTVVGVVLAAGTGSRFDDGNKLLAEWEGRPLVGHAARTLVASSLDRVVVVVGYEGDRVRTAVDGLGVTVVRNPAYERGQATSLRRGLSVAREAGADAVLFALGDMPAVDVATVDRLLAAYRAGVGDALAAAHDGRRGNPVLFDRRHFDALAAVDGDTGGRRIFLDADRSALVESDDPGVLLDIDDRTDLSTLD